MRRLLLWTLVGIVCGFSSLSNAQDSPTAVIRSAVEQVLQILRAPATQGGETRRQERIEQVRGVVLPYFDTEALAQRALGVHWRQLSPQEREQFVPLFTELLEKTYSETLDRYGQEAQVVFGTERREGNRAEVATQVYAPTQEQPVAISYFLHQKNGRWLIYDVQIENVSMTRNYRNQFTRILSSSSYDTLVQKIKERLQQLETAQS